MRIDILEEDVFNSISPVALEKYLINARWERLKTIPGEVSIWSLVSADGQTHRVWLPLDQELSDYAVSVKRLVSTVAKAEDQSQFQIIEDLETVAVGDVVRFKSYDQFNRFSSSLPLSEGIALARQAQAITTAAACATVKKRPILSQRQPKEVVDYLNNVRIGQTEPGSFSIKLISPLSSPYDQEVQFVEPLPQAEPFERQVVVTLMRSLSLLQTVATETHETGHFDFEAFQELVSEGVSANLCEAVTNTVDGQPRIRPLEVRVTWSYVMAPPAIFLPDTVAFTSDTLPYISRAAVLFRKYNPKQTTVRGYVTELRRGKDEPMGTVMVSSIFEGRKRTVRILLPTDSYNTAIQAHEGDFEIACEGVLHRQGNVYVLNQPANVHILR